jgi:phosphatidylglycerophosphate synthase
VIESSERRPIAARRWRASNAAAAFLARRGVSANAISVAGMGFATAAGLLLAMTSWMPPVARLLWLLAGIGIQARLIANMLDGMVALATGTASRVGELFNEIPDRVSDSAVLIGLGYAAGGDPMLGAVAALVAALTAYVRSVGKGAGVPQQFCGPMAKPHRMFAVTLVALVGVVDPRQTLLTAHAGVSLVVAAEVLVILGGLVTAVRRLRRIAASL